MTEQILILDFGSQYTQVIARRVRECNVYSTILRFDTPAAEIAALKPNGLILSGGPSSVYAPKAPAAGPRHFRAGHSHARHLLRRAIDGAIPRRQGGERPEARIRQGHAAGHGSVLRAVRQSARVAAGLEFARRQAPKLPEGFKPVAATENSEFAAIENRDAEILRPAIPSRSRPHAARPGDHRQFRPWRLRLRQKLDDAQLHRPGRGGNPQRRSARNGSFSA